MPGHGRMFAAVVRSDSPGTDGVPDQEAAHSGGNALWEGSHLPAGKVRGQDPQEALLGKRDGWMVLESKVKDAETEGICQERQKGVDRNRVLFIAHKLIF